MHFETIFISCEILIIIRNGKALKICNFHIVLYISGIHTQFWVSQAATVIIILLTFTPAYGRDLELTQN